MSARRPIAAIEQVVGLLSALAAKVAGTEVTTNAAGDSPNLTMGHPLNAVADDVSGGVILGGGSNPYNNVIGGDGSSTVNTLTPNATSAGTSAHISVIGGYDNVAGSISSKIISDHSYTAVGGVGHNAIFGGSSNRVESGGGYATIVGGYNNVIESGRGSFATGEHAVVSGGHACALGLSQTVSGDYSAAWGRGNTVASPYSTVVGGYLNEIPSGGGYATAQGFYAKTRYTGEQAHAYGRFDATGDAQTSVCVMRRQTTNATAATLGANGGSTAFALAANEAAVFECKVIARDTASTDAAAWFIRGMATRGASGAPTILGAAPVLIGASAGAEAWSLVVAGNSIGGIAVNVTGEAEKTIRWVQRMTITLVGG